MMRGTHKAWCSMVQHVLHDASVCGADTVVLSRGRFEPSVAASVWEEDGEGVGTMRLVVATRLQSYEFPTICPLLA
eukprot:3936289-Rhodomonas_salina.5